MQDLSSMTPPTSLIGYSSMTGSNTLTDESKAMTAPGTESEVTNEAERRQPEVGVSDNIPVGTPPDRNASRPATGHSAVAWALLPPNGYTVERA